PKGSTLTSSDTASFAQAQHRDAKLGEEPVEEESDYDALRVAQLQYISERSLFLLVSPQEPDEDLEELDHASG
ncbi:hypothetical protein L917_01462, partial [Phytophthora nicotianae]